MFPDNQTRELFQIVYEVAKGSDDTSTRNGALLVNPRNGRVLCVGWNHLMPGYGSVPEHHERPLKYDLIEHAERDLLYATAKMGIVCAGRVIVTNWAACPPCARAIVLAGVSHVIYHKACMDRTPARWADKVALGLEILRRGGVEVTMWDGRVGVKNFNNGKWWTP